LEPDLPKPIVRFVRLHPSAKAPTYGSAGAAAADLYADFSAESDLAPEEIIFDLEPGERHGFKTGFLIELPKGYMASIRDRSGLAFKNGITVLGGVIDDDYRGEISVILLNTSHETMTIKHGDRIAQMIVQPVEQAMFLEVEELTSSERGTAGFGSTGISADPLDDKIRELNNYDIMFDTIEDFTVRCKDTDMIGRAAQIVSSLQFQGADHSHVTWDPNRGSGAWLLIGSREEVIETAWAHFQEMFNENADLDLGKAA
jgi:dUTP pyrophosphatase